MKSKTPFLLPAVAGFAAMLAACAGETVDTETPAARSARLEGSEKTEKSPQDASERRGDARRERRRGRRGMHARGPLGLLKRAVQQLDLSDEQRSELDALRQSMMPREHGEKKILVWPSCLHQFQDNCGKNGNILYAIHIKLQLPHHITI